MTLDPAAILALLLWGTIAGIDLVSVPQAMLGRPIVAATVAGALLGDLDAGLRVGVLLECFALDLLPIGATRYPDYGPAAVVAAAAAAATPWDHQVGAAVLVGLIVSVVAGRGMEWQRRLNGRWQRRAAPALLQGDSRTLGRLQFAGLAADVVRSLTSTAIGLGLAALLMPWLAARGEVGPALTLVAVAGAVVAALTGAVRRAGAGLPRGLLAAGLAAGSVLAWLA